MGIFLSLEETMNISTSQAEGNVPVTIIKLDGHLDAQSYQDLITKAQELYDAGARDFLLDLSDLAYISSSGLVALCSVALLARGEKLPSTEDGQPASRPLLRAAEAGPQQHIKLLNPRSEIMHTFDIVGLATLFEVFTNLEEAIKSF
jgi:anti-anti-sigma factor